MSDAIQADQLVRTYPLPDGQHFTAVDRLSFSVATGEVYGLLGSNGAGKSTTMRMLATLIRPTHGTARVMGHDVVTHASTVRASLGYLSATSGLPTRVTCREVLVFFAGLQQLETPNDAADQAIEHFGITAFAGRRIETLSTGMRQRVRIAAAAIHDPPVLLLDEPTAGLDLVAADRLLDAILEARSRGTSVVFSTHILREATRICDRIGIIDAGRLKAEGTVEELKAQTGASSLDEAFLALVRE